MYPKIKLGLQERGSTPKMNDVLFFYGRNIGKISRTLIHVLSWRNTN